MYPSRTGSWITPKELAGLVGRWMECENENHDTKTWGCFLKTCLVEGGKNNLKLTMVRDLQDAPSKKSDCTIIFPGALSGIHFQPVHRIRMCSTSLHYLSNNYTLGT